MGTASATTATARSVCVGGPGSSGEVTAPGYGRAEPAPPGTVGGMSSAWASLRTWPARRWRSAVLAALVSAVVIALPTDLIPNPVFGRDVPPTAWSWPVLAVSSVLSGLLFATYVRRDDAELDATGRTGLLGGFLTYLAVGCPVCNKLALLALGYSGALRWFAPVQPWLAGLAMVLLAWALVRRLANDGACAVRPAPQPTAR